MSGGVDSSVAAALAVEQGYEVIGVMLRLWTHSLAECDNQNLCCTDDAVENAREVASNLGIPFYTLDASGDFRRLVVDSFVQSYIAGKTPNPCVTCNEHIRFGYLRRQAIALGAVALATGHYAIVEREVWPEQRYHLLRGHDRTKDQSYVLHMLGQEELASIWFPLGELTKARVRGMARRHNLSVANHSESQDLCFTGGTDYRKFLRVYAPKSFIPGDILDEEGRCIGRHDGLVSYTIGQRKGLGIATGSPMYVLEKDVSRNVLVVGPKSSMGRQSLSVSKVSFVSGQSPQHATRVQVQVRYGAPAARAMLHSLSQGGVRIDSDTELRGVTPGQAAVFYNGQECLGGGLIDQREIGS